MKLLLTGFDPFGGQPVNPAEEKTHETHRGPATLKTPTHQP